MTNHNDLVPGNVIERKKDGVFDHPAVIMPGRKVYENIPGIGEHLSDLSDFLLKAGNKIQIKTFSPLKQRENILNVYDELRNPRAWSWLNNCQDSINRITAGQPKSHQRDTAICVLAAGVVTYLIFRKH